MDADAIDFLHEPDAADGYDAGQYIDPRSEAPFRAGPQDLDSGIEVPGQEALRTLVVRMLNDALATEIVCMLRYKRHQFTAAGLRSQTLAEEFLGMAQEESMHAERLAQRIVELGGEPDFSPASLTERSNAAYDDSLDLTAMIEASLAGEIREIERYRAILEVVGGRDPETRAVIADMLSDEMDQAKDLEERLADSSSA